jgi:competence protein ComEA
MKKVILTLWLVLFWAMVAVAAVDINSAGKQELESLPGIGPAKAEEIIKYREDHGPFRSVDDLAKVKGIGRQSIETLRDHIEISN